MKKEFFLSKEIIESVKKSSLNTDFSNNVMDALQNEERTPLWHYAVYFFAFAFACTLCFIFGGKFSFDIFTDVIFRFFHFVQILLVDYRFYIVFTLILLITTIGFIRTNIFQYAD